MTIPLQLHLQIPYLLIPKRSFYLVSVVKKVFNTHLKLLMHLPRVIISSLTIPPAIHKKKKIYNNKKKKREKGICLGEKATTINDNQRSVQHKGE